MQLDAAMVLLLFFARFFGLQGRIEPKQRRGQAPQGALKIATRCAIFCPIDRADLNVDEAR
jgi:hypothetical protein